ncbi:hypothetical protein DXG01_006082 [Tephrocybe rancida]|nr:hypothetical protein DXG01_006082 [Tephrocybe rancida]
MVLERGSVPPNLVAGIIGPGALQLESALQLAALYPAAARGDGYSVLILPSSTFDIAVLIRHLDINLPLVGIAMLLALLFLRLKSPEGNVREKLAKIDWIGNFLVIAASVSLALGLTWAGVTYSWSSPQVLAPLILGILGLAFFVLYEIRWASNPIVPLAAIYDRTCLSGYLQIFCAAIPFVTLIFYLPVYFQACKGASPLRSGVQLFPLAFTVAPFSILTGLSVARTGRYRPQAWFGWAVIVLSMGLFGGTIQSTTRVAIVIGYQLVAAIGFGIVYSATYFPVLAPLPSSAAAHSLAFFAFFRQFAGIWAVTIGGAVLQNAVQTKLPTAFNDAIPGGSNAFYEVISELETLPEPLRSEVRAAFGDALKLTWLVVTGIAGGGLICSLFMRGLPLSASTDKDWGVEEKPRDLEADTAHQ